ncbi:Gfo/Idh/MocA family protein [Laspinema palackyanum]|uniref:Gfo/Idh/MocA family protein n=1 Tax=Laspinema palackyanum TaxID=3231601 RepID=UPI00345C9645|nr:Gfo/Idh/MocA family oxidoreductase [Laspinema sp. D2c]
MKVLVVGYGSIGQRHVILLKELGCKVAVVSRRSSDCFPCFSNLTNALTDWQPNYVVIASRTSEHYEDIKVLITNNFNGSVLVEKPLFDTNIQIPKHNFYRSAVAYNLRFHPLLKKLKKILESALNVVTVTIYVGSYLPYWRSKTDYRTSYSAHRQAGGGVLRDLSHELDYVLWLFGSWRRLTAQGGKFSSLEIDSDDVYSILMETDCCPLVSIHMNYLDKVPRREIFVNTDSHTIHIDLCQNTMKINGDEEAISLEKDATYRSEHQVILDLDSNLATLCSFEEARETLFTIEASEQAAICHTWIER